MTRLQSLFARFRNSRTKTRRAPFAQRHSGSGAESLEPRLLLAATPPLLSSNPGAPVTFYLDFDGHVETSAEWIALRSDGQTSSINTPAYDTDGNLADFGTAETDEITEIWSRVSEDFSPFDVNVTTSAPAVFNNSTHRVVVGGDGSWSSLTLNTWIQGSLITLDPNVSFIFSENQTAPRSLANSISWNLGHVLNLETHLAYDAFGNPTGGSFQGTAESGPILGGNRTLNTRSIWANLPGESSGNLQDDLASIINAGISYRADDHQDFTNATATPIPVTLAVETVSGIIGTNNDVDVFSMQILDTTATFSVTGLDLTTQFAGVTNPGSNLDPVLTLFDSSGNQIATDDPTLALVGANASLKASITQTLTTGTYYIQISNRGEYGNLGQYSLSVTGVDNAPVAVSVDPSTVQETDGLLVGIGRVERPQGQPTDMPLVIDLVSDDPTEITVPTTITIPANRSFEIFDVTVHDDALLDGGQRVAIQASVAGVLNSEAFLTVEDVEEIQLSLAPNPVDENAGTAVLTVTRSNTDVDAPNHWVTTNNQLLEYTTDGALIRTIDVEWPGGGMRPVGETARDVLVLRDGRIAIYNGTLNASLSLYNPNNDSWRHFSPNDGLSADPTDSTTGGIASFGEYVFLSDLESAVDDNHGLIRINVNTGEIVRFGDRVVGARIFALPTQPFNFNPSNNVYEFDPSTGELLNTLILSRPADAITFDGTHLWAVARGTGITPDELLKIDPDTGLVIETHPLGALQNSFFEGLTYLNGLLYIVDSQDDQTNSLGVEVYDPETRQVTGTILNIDDVNFIEGGSFLGTLAVADRLLVASEIENTIYEIDPLTGIVTSQFSATEGYFFNSVFFGFTPIGAGPGVTGISDVVIGGVTYDDVIYVHKSPNEFSVYTRDGVAIDANPATPGVIDTIRTDVPFTGDFSGQDVPGVSASEPKFKDVTVGFDGMLYSLNSTGDEILVHNPESLFAVAAIVLDTPVRTIAVADGTQIFAGGSNGQVIVFDRNGASTVAFDSGLGSIADIEVNISQEVLISDASGNVIKTDVATILAGDPAALTVLENTAGTAFVTFGRNPTRPGGDIVVNLQSDDLTELQVPASVIIPAGQMSIDVTVTVLDDNERDGDQIVTVTADSIDYTSGTMTVDVLDKEFIGVDVIADTVTENDGTIVDGIRIFRTDVDGPLDTITSQSRSVTDSVAIIDKDVTLSQVAFESQVSRVSDVNVTLTIQHDAIPDLDVYLISPSGTRVELFTDLSSNESNLTSTTLDDEAAIRIVDASAPYTGQFNPEQLLSTFDGENPSGQWTLEIIDDNTVDTGTLVNWSLDIITVGLSPAVITLLSNDTSEALVQTSVTIPVNQSEIFIPLEVLQDDLLDGVQAVEISVASIDLPGFETLPDLVDVTDAETITFSISQNTISESAGTAALQGTITRSDTSAGQIVLSLTSSDTTELAVPATVIIPAGQTFVTFDIDAVDDLEFDGPQQVTITASATGYLSADSEIITVTDQEPRLQMSTLSPTVSEDSGSLTITIARLDADDLTVPQQIILNSSDTTELTVPATVVIPAGEISTSFVATILGDALLDGAQTVTISAQDANTANPVINNTSLDITVEDAERILIVADFSTFAENAGAAAATGTVTVSAGGHTAPLFVTLVNNDSSEISIPDTVIIPVGETSATFVIDAVDDPIIDQNQIATVTGSLTDFLDGTLTLTVTDHEPPITTGPSFTTEDPTPTISWAPVDGATRYDLWVNDVSRNITQLFRNENEQAEAVLFSDDFESGAFDSNKWASNQGVEIDSLGINDPNGTVSAHFDGSADNVDQLQSVSMDFSGKSGVQLTYTFQQTGQGSSPEIGNDLVLSYRNAANEWVQLSRQLGSGPDMNQYQTVVIQLPETALHSSFALRIESFGPVDDGDIDTPLPVADWFVDSVRFAEYETFTPTQELGVGRYRFWVRAYDSLEQPTAWSRGRDFLIRTRPQIVSPGNQQFVAANSFPEISWTSVVDTASYDLWVNNVTTGESQVVRETTLQTTSFASELANLQGGTYRAWVRAVGPDGLTGFWSASTTFTVLAAPTNVGPSGTTFDRTPELRWDAVTGADSYYVWLTQRNPGEDPVVVLRDRFVTNTFRVPDTDLEDGNYALWVQAIAEDGTASSWSPATEFVVGGRPEIVLPGDNTLVSTTPTFLWTGITGTDVYEVWVNRVDVPTTRIVYSNSVEVASYTVTTPLPAGTYRLWVRAISEMGEASFWSRPVNFTVASVQQNDSTQQTKPSALTASLPEPASTVVVEVPQFEAMEATPDVQRTPVIEVPASIDAADSVESADAGEVVDSVMAELAVAEWWADSSGGQQQAKNDESSLAGAAVGFLATGTMLRSQRERKKRS